MDLRKGCTQTESGSCRLPKGRKRPCWAHTKLDRLNIKICGLNEFWTKTELKIFTKDSN